MNRFIINILLLIFLAFSFSKTTVFAQKGQLLLFKLRIDEDYLNYRGKGTDCYETGGLDIYIFYTARKNKKMLSWLDQKTNNNPVTFLSLRQITNTPINIQVPGPVQNDYPYAAALFVNYGKLYTNQTKKFRMGSTISLGAIGPFAMGDQIQTFFHKLVDYIQPQGWPSQLPNDLILNYRLSYEKKLWSRNQKLELIGLADVNAGLAFNNCRIGLLFRTGKQLNYFSSAEIAGFSTNKMHKGRFIFSMQPQLTIVGYNAILQGSLFKKRSSNWADDTYVIKRQDINRIIYGFAFGITYETKFAGLSFTQHMQRKEFRQVKRHEYGNVGLVFKIGKRGSSNRQNE